MGIRHGGLVRAIAVLTGLSLMLASCAPPTASEDTGRPYVRYTVTSSSEAAADLVEYTDAGGRIVSVATPGLPWSVEISGVPGAGATLRLVDAQTPVSAGTATATVANRLQDGAADFVADGVAAEDLAVDPVSGQTSRVTAVTTTQLFLQNDIFTAGEPYEVYTPQLYSLGIYRVDPKSGAEGLAVFGGQSYNTDLTLQTVGY